MSNIKFAYTSWWNDGVQCSALYRGKRAERLVNEIRKGDSFASLYYGGDEIVDQYIEKVNTWRAEGHAPLTREVLLAPVPARAGRKGF